MKTVLTLIAVIFFGTTAMAQEAKAEVKVETITLTVQLDIEVNTTTVKEHTTEVARLYMFKNSRIKKALAFKTKRNKAKMA